MRYPCPYDYPDNCNCTTNDRRGVVPRSRTRRSSDRRQRRGSNLGSSESLSGGDKFEGRPIKIIRGETGRKERFEFFHMTGGAASGSPLICSSAVKTWDKSFQTVLFSSQS